MLVFPTRDWQGLLTIFSFSKKKDLEKHCRDLTIYSGDFVNLILWCADDPAAPFLHQIHYTDTIPEHLTPTPAWGDALGANGVGPLKPAAQKIVNKLGSLFEQRRWLVGHLFYTANLNEWHFVYFDQRDTESSKPNHWKEGAHVHLVNWLWPNLDAKSVWGEFVQNNNPPGGALHIRYDRTAVDQEEVDRDSETT